MVGICTPQQSLCYRYDGGFEYYFQWFLAFPWTGLINEPVLKRNLRWKLRRQISAANIFHSTRWRTLTMMQGMRSRWVGQFGRYASSCYSKKKVTLYSVAYIWKAFIRLQLQHHLSLRIMNKQRILIHWTGAEGVPFFTPLIMAQHYTAPFTNS